MAVILLSKTSLNYDYPERPRETANGGNSVATIELRNVKEEYNCNEGEIDYSMEVKSYRRRFYMLMLYFVLATLGSMLYPQHIAEANVTGCYYGVSQIAVNWTSQITMLTYIVLIIPVSLLMNILDLRWTLILGSILNTASVSLQFLALKPDGFAFVMVSCLFDALASVFIIGMSPFLAARWFPADEISRACAFGVLGNEIGVSFGLMFTPLLVSTDCSKPEEIEVGKRNVAYILTSLNVVLLIVLFFTFQNAPEVPPSVAQAEKKMEDTAGWNNLGDILRMMKNPQFCLVFILSGLMTGSFFNFTTNANHLMIRFFPDEEVAIAGVATTCAFIGVVGALCAGCFMDYTHKFKETAVALCMAALVFHILFSTTLYLKTLWIQYLLAAGFGFCVAGFLPVGLEYAVEITFPASEMISSNLQYLSCQGFSLIIVQTVTILLNSYGPIPSAFFLACTLLLCSVITCFLTRNYKRSTASAPPLEDKPKNGT